MHKLENRIKEREQLYLFLCQIANQLDSGVVILDPVQDHKIIFVNNLFINMTEYSEEELFGSSISIMTGPLTNIELENGIFSSLQTNSAFKATIYHYRKDRTGFWNELSVLPIKDHEGDVQFFLLMARDVTDQVNIEALMTLERDVYASIEKGTNIVQVFEQMCEYISITFQKVCHACIYLKDLSRLKLIASTSSIPRDFKKLIALIDLKQSNNEQLLEEILREPIILNNLEQAERWPQLYIKAEQYNIQSVWHQVIENQEGEILGMFTLYFEDQVKHRPSKVQFLKRLAHIVALAIKYSNQKKEILQLAFYDNKTGLPNFTSFQNELDYRNDLGRCGVIYIIEAGEYQNIVDLYGRQGGDTLLFQLARRIALIPSFRDAIIARYTSSAIVLASDCAINDHIENHLNEILLEPFIIEDKNVFITLKIGTSNYDQYVFRNEAVKRADTALSVALKSVGTVVVKYDESQVETIQKEMDILTRLSSALKKDEFIPVLQPKVNMTTGEIESFEALARWISNDIGFISPAIFIAVAESTGNIHKIDRAILKKVLEWLKNRQELGKKMYEIAVNISPSHFYYPGFVENTMQLIQSYNVDPRYIKLEITESIELENIIRAKKTISELQSYGIATAIDDFGVGYSSLSYLRELPFDEIKIDKSFIDHLADPRMHAVITTIIQLASSLNMKAVAEGIETEQQGKQLQQIGCDVGQGYYFYKPMFFDEIDALLEKNATE